MEFGRICGLTQTIQHVSSRKSQHVEALGDVRQALSRMKADLEPYNGAVVVRVSLLSTVDPWTLEIAWLGTDIRKGNRCGVRL